MSEFGVYYCSASDRDGRLIDVFPTRSEAVASASRASYTACFGWYSVREIIKEETVLTDDAFIEFALKELSDRGYSLERNNKGWLFVTTAMRSYNPRFIEEVQTIREAIGHLTNILFDEATYQHEEAAEAFREAADRLQKITALRHLVTVQEASRAE